MRNIQIFEKLSEKKEGILYRLKDFLLHMCIVEKNRTSDEFEKSS